MPDRSAAIAALRDLLRRREAAGAETVYLTRGARETLRRGIAASPAGGAKPASGRGNGSDPEGELPGTPAEFGRAAPAACRGDTPAEQIEDLRRQAAEHGGARSLGTLHETAVFSCGDPTADLLFVVEAPGAEDEQRGEPLAGDAGRKFDQVLKAMGLARESVYVTTLCKFRPAVERGEVHRSRRPTPEEMRSCLPFVLAEIKIVQPKVIVALGGIAAEGLLQIDRASVPRLRGRLHDLDGTPLMVTWHPSRLIRAEEDPDGGMEKKRLAWEDMLLVMEQLGLPVSEKQRGYFR